MVRHFLFHKLFGRKNGILNGLGSVIVSQGAHTVGHRTEVLS